MCIHPLQVNSISKAKTTFLGKLSIQFFLLVPIIRITLRRLACHRSSCTIIQKKIKNKKGHNRESKAIRQNQVAKPDN
jgi:hypothetical protein